MSPRRSRLDSTDGRCGVGCRSGVAARGFAGGAAHCLRRRFDAGSGRGPASGRPGRRGCHSILDGGMAIVGLGSSVRPWIRRFAIAACVVLGPLSCWTLWGTMSKPGGWPQWLPRSTPAGSRARRRRGPQKGSTHPTMPRATTTRPARSSTRRASRGRPACRTGSIEEMSRLRIWPVTSARSSTAITKPKVCGSRPRPRWSFGRPPRLRIQLPRRFQPIRVAALADLRTLERTQGGDGDGAVVAVD